MRRLFLSLLMVVAICASSQGNAMAADKEPPTADEVKKQAQQALNATKEYTLQQKQEYQKKFDSQLAELSKKIDELKAKAKTAKQDAAAKLEGTIAELKKKQEAAEKRLPEPGSTTSKAWGEVKAGADKAMDDLKKAYESAKSHFE